MLWRHALLILSFWCLKNQSGIQIHWNTLHYKFEIFDEKCKKNPENNKFRKNLFYVLKYCSFQSFTSVGRMVGSSNKAYVQSLREGLQPKVISVFGGSCTLYFVFCTLILCYYVHFDVKSVKIMITYFMITIAHETTYNFVQKISFYENNNLCKKFKIIHWWCRVIFLCSKILQSANSLDYFDLHLPFWLISFC